MNYPDRVISFRADASLDLGTGHVMRCLSLADELRARGATCYFMCRAQPGDFIAEIERRGYRAHILTAVGDFVHGGADANQELRLASKSEYERLDSEGSKIILSNSPADMVVVDHYSLGKKWETAVRAAGRFLVAIDDLADRSHDCDLLIDQNLGRSETQYRDLVPAYCRLLIGPSFALLRPEFAQWREYSLRRRETPRLQNLLIAMGGVDRLNVTGAVLAALHKCKLPADIRVTVVVGKDAPWISDLKRRAEGLPWATDLVVHTGKIAGIMANSDLAIGAAGGTAWERCCLGLPTLIVALAENQRLGANALARANAAADLGVPGELADSLPVAIKNLAVPEHLLEMSSRASQIVDGGGAGRVRQHMGELLERS